MVYMPTLAPMSSSTSSLSMESIHSRVSGSLVKKVFSRHRASGVGQLNRMAPWAVSTVEVYPSASRNRSNRAICRFSLESTDSVRLNRPT